MSSPGPRAVHARVANLVTELLMKRAQTLNTIGVPQNTLTRVAGGKADYLVSTLVEVADALGCDVVVNFRERV